MHLKPEEKKIFRQEFRELEYRHNLHGVGPFTVRVYEGDDTDCLISFTLYDVFFECNYCRFRRPSRANLDRFVQAAEVFMRTVSAVKWARSNIGFNLPGVLNTINIHLLEDVCRLKVKVEANIVKLNSFGFYDLFWFDRKGRRFLVNDESRELYAWIEHFHNEWKFYAATARKYRPIDVMRLVFRFQKIFLSGGFSPDDNWGIHGASKLGFRAKVGGKQVIGLQTKYMAQAV